MVTVLLERKRKMKNENCTDNVYIIKNSNRQQRLQEGLQLDREGKRSEAYQKYVQAVSVDLDIIGEFLQLLIRLHVPYIMAPYESDAQLAFLSRTGIVDAVISEDSDTLCYQCPKVILKLSPEGNCKLVDLEQVYCTDKTGMLNWSPELFELMCVLNGCDYAEGCDRIGLKTAIKYINMGKSFQNTLDIIAAKPVHHFHDYEKMMYSALACFHHQVIYNPILNQREYLTPISEEEFEEYVKKQKCPFGDLKTESISIRRAKGFISDDAGTLLIPSDSSVDYLDDFFKNVKPRTVSKRFALPLRTTKDNHVDVNELLKNHKNVIFDKPTSVKSNHRNSVDTDFDHKRFHDDSPTSVVIYDCTSLSDDSFSEGFMKELESVEKTLD